MVPGHELVPSIHPDTRFRNGLRAATKWRETTPNMSFGPKEVIGHVRCEKTRNGSRGTNSCLVSTLILVSQWVTCGNVMAQNDPKPKFWKWIGHLHCEKTRNGSGKRTHALYPPRHAFSQWVTCGNEMA